jgi:hypothetical protein
MGNASVNADLVTDFSDKEMQRWGFFWSKRNFERDI